MARGNITLPSPDCTGTVPLETVLARRHSVRDFADTPIEIAELAQLSWAGIGVNRPDGGRTIASAGALNPLELYVVAGAVRSVAPGVYRYDARCRTLAPVRDGDARSELARAAVGQEWFAHAPVILAVVAVNERSAGQYGDRGVRYARMEAGLAAQNIALQAEALGLGTTFVGAFDDWQVSEVLRLPDTVRPLALLPIGTPVRT